ncbi:MAG TPA: Rid family detoxifying hydrolase [Candidatus Limnocylindria bacterium]|jgi:2-iminobutanoate/2-iminopropanoate deaminase|nr:Rid family detoxifying hydrolase [Candidatus Limnocylindria bacterium]
MTRKAVATDLAPKALGPYSQGIDAGDYVFVSGQVGIDPVSGAVAEGVAAQAERAFANVAAILDAAGCTWVDVVKVTLWLTKAEDFATVNAVYAKFVGDPAPARSAPIVAALPRGFLISVEAIAKRQ